MKLLTTDSTKATFIMTDLSDPESIKQGCAEAVAALGRIDGLVNAGTPAQHQP